MNDLHLLVVDRMNRQLEQDMPQPMVRNGIVDETQIGGTKQHANLLALVIALKIKAGRSLFKKHCERNGICLSKMIKSAILLLTCEKWCHSNVLHCDVDRSGPAFRELKYMVLKHYPCNKICKRVMVGKSQNSIHYQSFPST